MKKNIKSGAGFTIIELIVVIAIIAILAGIVLVNVTQYINKSKDVAIKSNLRTVMVDAAAAIAENKLTSTTISGDTAWMAVASIQTTETKRISSVDVANSKFCACAQLLVGTTPDWFCVDHNGVPKQVTNTTPCAAANCGAAVSPFCP